ncbi:MAG: sulfotransferase domain-containing protein [Planctomycetaceae bacterium]
MSQPKEPMFFSRSESKSGLKRYVECFASGPECEDVRVIGEASTTYLSFPHVPSRIAGLLGTDLKFIFVLRNPAERAVSAYWHTAKRFHEFRSLDEVFMIEMISPGATFAAEDQGIRLAEEAGQIVTTGYDTKLGDRHWQFRYLRNSFYIDDLKRYEGTFGRDQLLVLLTDDLSTRPVETFRRIASFLGIDGDSIPLSVGTRHNVTKVPSRNTAARLLLQMTERSPPFLARLLRRVHSAFRSSAPAAPAVVSESLGRLFREHNEQLSEYLNRDLLSWATPLSLTPRLSQHGISDAQ